jgi:hypothetical protein
MSLKLRYTTFLVLYPSGFAGELGVLVSALNEVQTYSNTTYYVYLVVIVLWFPGELLTQYQLTNFVGLPLMYSHMLRQRKSQLSNKKKE